MIKNSIQLSFINFEKIFQLLRLNCESLIRKNRKQIQKINQFSGNQNIYHYQKKKKSKRLKWLFFSKTSKFLKFTKLEKTKKKEIEINELHLSREK